MKSIGIGSYRSQWVICWMRCCAPSRRRGHIPYAIVIMVFHKGTRWRDGLLILRCSVPRQVRQEDRREQTPQVGEQPPKDRPYPQRKFPLGVGPIFRRLLAHHDAIGQREPISPASAPKGAR